MKGTVILVCHNSSRHLEECLRSLQAQPDWRVLVIDNNSSDDSVQKARKIAPYTEVVTNSENRGFAGAVNQGVRASDTELVLVLNPDVVAHAGALDRLREGFDGGNVGAVTGMLCREDGLPQVGFAIRSLPTLRSALAEVLLLNRLWPNNPVNRAFRCLDFDYGLAQDVQQPAGACLAFRRKAWEDIGGFDEGFFPVWFEDVDFCKRLHDHGWTIRYIPDGIFLHSGGHSVRALPFADQQAIWYRNLLRYFWKHSSPWQYAFLRAGVILGLLLRSAVSILGVGPKGESLTAAVRGYLHAAWNYALLGRVNSRHQRGWSERERLAVS